MRQPDPGAFAVTGPGPGVPDEAGAPVRAMPRIPAGSLARWAAALLRGEGAPVGGRPVGPGSRSMPEADRVGLLVSATAVWLEAAVGIWALPAMLVLIVALQAVEIDAERRLTSRRQDVELRLQELVGHARGAWDERLDRWFRQELLGRVATADAIAASRRRLRDLLPGLRHQVWFFDGRGCLVPDRSGGTTPLATGAAAVSPGHPDAVGAARAPTGADPSRRPAASDSVWAAEEIFRRFRDPASAALDLGNGVGERLASVLAAPLAVIADARRARDTLFHATAAWPGGHVFWQYHRLADPARIAGWILCVDFAAVRDPRQALVRRRLLDLAARATGAGAHSDAGVAGSSQDEIWFLLMPLDGDDGPVAPREKGVSRRHRGGNGAQSPVVGDGSVARRETGVSRRLAGACAPSWRAPARRSCGSPWWQRGTSDVVSVGSAGSVWSDPGRIGTVPPAALAAIRGDARNLRESGRWVGEWLVVPHRLDSDVLLVGFAPRPLPAWPLALGVMALWAGASFILLRRWLLAAWQEWGLATDLPGKPACGFRSLRHRLWSCYLLAVGLPLAVAVGVACWWRLARPHGMRESHRRAAIQHLVEIDRGFRGQAFRHLRQRRRLAAECARVMADGRRLRQVIETAITNEEGEPFLIDGSGQVFPTYDPQPLILRRVIRWSRPQRMRFVHFFRGRNDDLVPDLAAMLRADEPLLASTPAALLGRLRSLPMPAAKRQQLAGVGEMILARHNAAAGGEMAGRDLVMAGLGGDSVETVVRRMAIRRGDYLKFTAEWYFHDLLLDRRGTARYLVAVSELDGDLAWARLQRVMARGAGVRPPHRLHAVTFHPKRLSVPEVDEPDRLGPLVEPVDTEALREYCTEVNLDGEPTVLVALRASQMDEYLLVLLTPSRWFAEQLAVEWRMVGAGLAVLLAVALALAVRLEAGFLAPVAQLDLGLRAVRAGDYDLRLAPRADDEFGRLCLAFNQALPRLRDMDLARQVQKAMLPAVARNWRPPAGVAGRVPVWSGGFDLVGRSEMMREVGGDVLEVVDLDDGRCAVAVGDVAGHGVSAALVTAMVSLALPELVRRHADDPAAALLAVNQLLVDQMKGAKMLTCLLAVIDPWDGVVTIANGGHNWPLLVDSAGSINYLHVIGMPLGVRARTRVGTHRQPLAGETLIFYTDGLVEARRGPNDTLGYDRFAGLASDAARLPVAAALDRLIADVRAFLAGRTPDDDLTAVMLRPAPHGAGRSAGDG